MGLAGAGAGVHQRPCNGHVRLNISGIAYPHPVSYPYLLHIRIHAIRTYPYLLIWHGPLDLLGGAEQGDQGLPATGSR